MNKKLRIVLIVILALVFLGSGAWLLRNHMSVEDGNASYDEARELAMSTKPSDKPQNSTQESAEPQPGTQTPEEEAPAEPKLELDESTAHLGNMDLDALRELNSDVIGWIEIPGTKISYPMVQGEDNDFYLDHDWENKSSALGSIFMDYRSDSDFDDFNTIIYGHRMANGSMFQFLTEYKDQSVWEANPYVYIVTDEGVSRYAIFASYETESGGGHSYRLGLESDEDRQAYIDYILGRSKISCGIEPEPNDEMITLSTCVAVATAYGTRWVVHAVYDCGT